VLPHPGIDQHGGPQRREQRVEVEDPHWDRLERMLPRRPAAYTLKPEPGSYTMTPELAASS